jgi:predicted nucleic acid-binding protein
MIIGFDSNILIYMAGGVTTADHHKVEQSFAIYSDLLETEELVVPVQALGEAYRVLTRKFKFPVDVVKRILSEWEDSFTAAGTQHTTLQDAVEIASTHGLQIWDAIILAASFEAGCSILLSEDMQHGFVWRGLTVINPFADDPHPLLASLL